jgi:hypothetical protein
MRRRNGPTLSLLLFVTACVLWAGSYLPERIWLRCVQGRLVVVAATGVAARLVGGTYFEPPGVGPREFLRSLRADGPPFDPTRLRLGTRVPPTLPTVVLGVELAWATVDEAGRQDTYYVVTVPLIYLALATGAAWLMRRLRGGAGRRSSHLAADGKEPVPDTPPERRIEST